MNVVITGTSGFIGKNLVPLLSESGHFIRKVVRSPVKCNSKNNFKVDGISAATNWNGCFNGIDCVVHLAGLAHSSSYSKEDYESVNTLGSINLAKAAAKNGVKRFIFVSTIGVNGNYTEGCEFSSTDEPKPHNDYSDSKYQAELGLKAIALESKMEVFIIRPVLVYGINATGSFSRLSKLVRALPVLPFGLIDNRRSFISVDNLCDLLKTCLEHKTIKGGTFLATEEGAISTKDFTNAIAQGYGCFSLNLPIPVFIMKLFGRILGQSAIIQQLTGDLEVNYIDTRKVLGWSPPYTMQESMALLNKRKEV